MKISIYRKTNWQLCVALFVVSGIFIGEYKGEYLSSVYNKVSIEVENGKNFKESFDGEERELWPYDDQCEMFKVRLGEGLNLTYLASYPRSGNSWTRYLIEAASGILTGSVYESPIMLNLGYIGEKEDPKSGKVILVKTHGNALGKSVSPFFEPNSTAPVILLVRNIEKSVLSYWNFLQINDFFFNVQNSSYKTRGFRKHVREGNYRWLKMNEEVLKNCINLSVVFYENLVKRPVEEVQNILKQLKFEIDPRRLECLKKHTDGPAKRKHDQVDPYTSEEKTNFIKSMKLIITLLKTRGFDYPEEYNDYINGSF